jgi:hypothetical protein
VIKSHATIDCGATSYTFIVKDDAHSHHLPLHFLNSPRNLTIIDRKPVTSGAITYITLTPLVIWNYQKDIPLFVTKLGYYLII